MYSKLHGQKGFYQLIFSYTVAFCASFIAQRTEKRDWRTILKLTCWVHGTNPSTGRFPISQNVSIKCFSKDNSPTKLSTYCALFFIKTISWRFGGGVDSWNHLINTLCEMSLEPRGTPFLFFLYPRFKHPFRVHRKKIVWYFRALFKICQDVTTPVWH